jgi:DNA-binding beta-propeller fold protein YncE
MNVAKIIRRTAVLALVLAAGIASSASGAVQYVTTWGREGTGAGEFGSGVLGGGSLRQNDTPTGIAVARDGSVYVTDSSNNRVQRFTAEGRFLGSFGRRGQDPGFLQIRLTDRMLLPTGLAIDGANNIFLSDTMNDRVMRYTASGRFLRRLGRHGSYRGQLVSPWGVAVSATTAFVADQGNYKIERFTKTGRFLGSFGSFGRGAGQLVTPYGVGVSPNGAVVYVTDYIRNRVMTFTFGGRFLSEFGSFGTGTGQFLRPAGVAVARDGSLYVADRCGQEVEHFTASGAFIESFGGGILRAPTFVAVDRSDNIYVSDYHRVVKFRQSGAFGARASAARGPRARAASHNGQDLICRHVREMAEGRYP